MNVCGSSNAQSAQSMIIQVTQQMQVPLSYADAVVGTAGAIISYIHHSNAATVIIQETRGVPWGMTVELLLKAKLLKLIQNFMASQAQMGGPADQGYNPYASRYGSPPSNPGHTGGYGSLIGSNYGY